MGLGKELQSIVVIVVSKNGKVNLIADSLDESQH